MSELRDELAAVLNDLADIEGLDPEFVVLGLKNVGLEGSMEYP